MLTLALRGGLTILTEFLREQPVPKTTLKYSYVAPANTATDNDYQAYLDSLKYKGYSSDTELGNEIDPPEQPDPFDGIRGN